VITSESYLDLDYAGTGDRNQMLDLRLPPTARGPAPVIVWFHGGGWHKGDKRAHDVPAPVIDRYLARGYAVASANYRLAQQASFPAQIHDGKAVIRFLRGHAQQFNLDPARIGVWGQSAGAYLAVFLGLTNGNPALEGNVGQHLDQSSAVRVVVNRCAPTDMTLPNQPAALMEPFHKMLGDANPVLAAQASPVTYVSQHAVPMLIVHGEDDAIVPIHHAKILAAALQNVGAEVAVLPLQDSGHGTGRFQAPATDSVIDGFFDKHLHP